MKLKHWMESLSRSRKKSKNDPTANVVAPQTVIKEKSRSKKLSVKDIIMPISGERKHVRNNYPAVAAYLDHRHPLSTMQNLKTFRPVAATSWQYQETNYQTSRDTVYDIPQQQCACFRHKKLDGRCEDMEESFTDDFSSTSGTMSQRRVNIRTNPWIRPEVNSMQRDKPVPPPKPLRKRPPIPFACEEPQYQLLRADDDSDMIICSDKSVGTDGDESLLDEVSSYCDCDDCCETGSCHSFSSLKQSSTNTFSFSSGTIQPDDSDRCSITSTPTILNEFEYPEKDQENERDSAVGSPGSSNAVFSNNSGSHRTHFSPAGSWKYFDDEDEPDSGLPTTASSLGSPGSMEDYCRRSVYQSNSSTRMLLDGNHEQENNSFDIDTNIEIIRTRLQKQVYQLKHETNALDRQMGHSRDFSQVENIIEEDFMSQKRQILAETLKLLKRQLDEQNDRLHTSYSALQNLQKRQINRHEPRNRDGRALSALYNQSLRETFC